MKSLWDDNEATKHASDPVQMRVYTSRLLGQNDSLVLHGGGNTSVKARVLNVLGDTDDLLFIKGSGWDLATIEAGGFAPARLDPLRRLATLETLTDGDMVRYQRAAMTDPGAPTPSVEAILHAIIPFTYVDHTHADAIVLITNTENGAERIREIYGKRVLIVPYVMPGFVLAKTVYQMTRDTDWQSIEGMVLLNHGLFTFGDDARTSYERTIALVSDAEKYLADKAPIPAPAETAVDPDPVELARLRSLVSKSAGHPLIARTDASPLSVSFSNLDNVSSIATRGPLTPDHVIRTKRTPLVVTRDFETDLQRYTAAYRSYFQHNQHGELTMLDPAPRWAVWQNNGTVAFGRSARDAQVVSDIVRHTMASVFAAEALGGWQPLPEKEIFDVEYWELEQAKLKSSQSSKSLLGKIAVVTGAASGIGRACAEMLVAEGAVVAGLDIEPRVTGVLDAETFRGHECDVTDLEAVAGIASSIVRQYGGIDIVISNAGVFPGSETIGNIDAEQWRKTLDVNLTSHQQLLQTCLPYLEHGVEPAVVIIGSKNVPAPGKGQASYSVSKAGLTQFARVAALELGERGIRVNVIHPNNVFDTALWTNEIIEERARHYGMSVNDYKMNNVLGVNVTSRDVAAMVCAMVGSVFAKTTGAQVPVDGGNERII